MSLIRSVKHSNNRSPEPQSNEPMTHIVPSSCPNSAATSAWFNTTGKRDVGRAQVNSPKSPRLLWW